MEPEGSLPCSQQPINISYSEPHASSPHLPNLFPKIHSNILPSMPMSSELSLLFRFSDQNFFYPFLISPIRATYPTHLTLKWYYWGDEDSVPCRSSL